VAPLTPEVAFIQATSGVERNRHGRQKRFDLLRHPAGLVSFPYRA